MLAQGFNFTITAREKSVYSIWEKMKKKEIPFSEVYDVFAIRVVIDSPVETEKADCWKVYSIITDYYRPNMDRLRDWISIPKANGYEALHTTVMSHSGQWVEIQIRSRKMDDIAERGYAAHWKYKESLGLNNQLDNWLDRIREMIESPDGNALQFVDDVKGYFFLDEISIFTPQGELRTLPANSSVLDFAYAIHTEIGNTCIGAKVDKKLVPINYELRNGQQVEIITSTKQSPKEEWLAYVRTTRARSNIKLSVKEEKKRHFKDGKEKMEKLFLQADLEFSHENIKQFIQASNFNSLIDLYYAASLDKIGPRDVKLFASSNQKNGWLNFLTRPKGKYVQKEGPDRDLVMEPVIGTRSAERAFESNAGKQGYETAACCNPIPGDEVIGLIASDDLPIQIHRTNCPKAIELVSSFGNRVVKLNWVNKESISFLSKVRLTRHRQDGNDQRPDPDHHLRAQPEHPVVPY